jgi:membrane protein implicated in regulation of membrane protease activity
VWRKLSADVWAIVGAVFSLLGVIFAITGTVLTATLVALFIGLPFAGLGTAFLAVGLALLIWRYQRAQRILDALRLGEASLGTIVDAHENHYVKVNNRHPWTITYRFSVLGQEFEGKTTTLRGPEQRQQAGQPVYILYLEGDPTLNTIYPPVM